MKLYLNDTSPFSRVALATALLTNVQEFELVWVDPWSSPTELLQVNPFSMILHSNCAVVTASSRA